MLRILIVFFTLIFGSICLAKTKLKIAVLSPEGTSWANNLKKMAREVKEKTAGEVQLKIYFGGAQGDEPDVLRKIHVGQLHGGVFTGKTLGEINGDVRVMEIPFSFRGNKEKAWQTLSELRPYFDKGFQKNNFENLGFYELGSVYFVSQKKTQNLAALNGVKIWSWQGDKLVESIMNSMNLVSVPLALPDVLSSLSTGVIDAAYAPPMGIVALQWNTKIKYIIDLPLSYSIGAFLISQKAWKKIKPQYQKIVQNISESYVQKVNQAIRVENKESLEAMKQFGVEFLKFPESDLKKSLEVRKKVISQLRGNLFSEDAFRRFEKKL